MANLFNEGDLLWLAKMAGDRRDEDRYATVLEVIDEASSYRILWNSSDEESVYRFDTVENAFTLHTPGSKLNPNRAFILKRRL